MPNPLKSGRNGNGLGATDSAPQPGDFPLGSVESPAAARARLEHEKRMSPYDEDCLIIYSQMSCLDLTVSPGASDIEREPAYLRGKQIHEILHGPVIPSHLDPCYSRHCFATAHLLFKIVKGRKPVPGDVLRYEEIDALLPAVYGELNRVFREAWRRRLPQYPCPLRYEDGKLYRRSVESKREVWTEDRNDQPREAWASIEAEALEIKGPRPLATSPPTIRTVVFVLSEEGHPHPIVKPVEIS